MMRIAILVLYFLCGSIPVFCGNAFSWNITDQVSEVLRIRLNHSENGQPITCKDRKLCSSAVLPRFYRHRKFQPVWSSSYGLTPEAKNLVVAIKEAEFDGLRSEDYHLSTIENLFADSDHSRIKTGTPDPDILADLDLLLTDAVLLYASHLISGRVNPDTIPSEWFIKSETVDLLELLESILSKGQIESSINRLRHQNPEYALLRQYLIKYRRILNSGGWPQVPGGKLLKKNTRGERVRVLKTRLMISGDLDEIDNHNAAIFDGELEKAVKRFQKRHGLRADGIVGSNTLTALNVTVQERINQIRANLERLRWIPNDFGQRYVLVNIAGFRLHLIDNRKKVLSMRVVVGRKSRGTPVFKSSITHVELNPYWNIPPKIASEDILPKILKDPDYLANENIKVYAGWGENAPEIDPQHINWPALSSQYFPYKLRQEPGSKNALGRIKFIFPNKFDIYLHDTPARGLFDKIQRDFSSGCIRIEKPIELTEYLLTGDQRWTLQKVLEIIDEGRHQVIRLAKPIDIYMLYLTAWTDEDGMLNFRDDIYGRDVALQIALNQRPPSNSEDIYTLPFQ